MIFFNNQKETAVNNLPIHVAVIPDGNRRWAKARGLMPSAGHYEGVKRFREISQAAFELGIPYFTFWAASKDNLIKRNPLEVRFLAGLLREELAGIVNLEKFVKNNVRFLALGRGKDILRDGKITELIEGLEAKTSSFTKHHLTLLFGYDGKSEMLDAVKKICKDSPRTIDLETIKKSLWTSELPQVDLVIRTGEEEKGWAHFSSGFMMWDTANAEFYFTDTLWPNFTEEKFREVVSAFSSRQRRFGA